MSILPYVNEPFIDFTDAGARARQEAALAEVAAQFGRSYPLVIGGENVTTDRTIRSTTPDQPAQLVGEVASAGTAEAVRALEAAEAAFSSWRKVPVAERSRILIRAAAMLRRRKYEFNAWLIHEVGKTFAEADGETAEAIDFLEYYARQALKLGGPGTVHPFPGEENEYAYLPLGVGVVHPPFNFPLAILLGMVSAAVVTGNTVVVKPSVHAPVLAAQALNLMVEAGLPAGVVNYLPGDPTEIGELLTVHPLVRFVNFTGSAAVGAHLFELSAKRFPGQRFLRRFIGEMGGKDAIVVTADADLDAAAQGIVVSAFGYSGQKCSACSRAIVEASVYDEVLAKVVALASNLRLGAAAEAGTQVGPVVSAAAHDRILNAIEAGKAEGRLVLGGASAGGQTVQPTIFADVAPTAKLAQEEIFGPVLAFIKAADFADAIEIANGTVYGLTGAIYSRNPEHLRIAREEFHAGNLYLNRKCTGAFVGVQPFGGFNMSGTNSKAGGPDYLLLFSQAKAIAEKL